MLEVVGEGDDGWRRRGYCIESGRGQFEEVNGLDE